MFSKQKESQSEKNQTLRNLREQREQKSKDLENLTGVYKNKYDDIKRSCFEEHDAEKKRLEKIVESLQKDMGALVSLSAGQLRISEGRGRPRNRAARRD